MMSTDTIAVEISADVFEVARRAAALDKVDVATLVESLVRRHAEFLAVGVKGEQMQAVGSGQVT